MAEPTQEQAGQDRPSRPVAVRPAIQSDAEAIAALVRQLAFDISLADLCLQLASILDHPDHAVYVATLPGTGVAGWVHVFSVLRLGPEPFAVMGGLVVDGACRGHGAGRALVAAAESWTLAHGYRLLRARSRSVRIEAHTFYEALGYRRIKTQFAFEKALGNHG